MSKFLPVNIAVDELKLTNGETTIGAITSDEIKLMSETEDCVTQITTAGISSSKSTTGPSVSLIYHPTTPTIGITAGTTSIPVYGQLSVNTSDKNAKLVVTNQSRNNVSGNTVTVSSNDGIKVESLGLGPSAVKSTITASGLVTESSGKKITLDNTDNASVGIRVEKLPTANEHVFSLLTEYGLSCVSTSTNNQVMVSSGNIKIYPAGNSCYTFPPALPTAIGQIPMVASISSTEKTTAWSFGQKLDFASYKFGFGGSEQTFSITIYSVGYMKVINFNLGTNNPTFTFSGADGATILTGTSITLSSYPYLVPVAPQSVGTINLFNATSSTLIKAQLVLVYASGNLTPTIMLDTGSSLTVNSTYKLFYNSTTAPIPTSASFTYV